MLRNEGEKTDRPGDFWESWGLGELVAWALSPGTDLGLAGMGSLVSLPAVPRASSAGARTVTWPTPAPVSRTVPSTARAATDASTAACRNAWHWACRETVRPAGGRPPPHPPAPRAPPAVLHKRPSPLEVCSPCLPPTGRLFHCPLCWWAERPPQTSPQSPASGCAGTTLLFPRAPTLHFLLLLRMEGPPSAPLQPPNHPGPTPFLPAHRSSPSLSFSLAPPFLALTATEPEAA